MTFYSSVEELVSVYAGMTISEKNQAKNAGFCDEKNFVEAVGLMKAYLIEHKLI